MASWSNYYNTLTASDNCLVVIIENLCNTYRYIISSSHFNRLQKGGSIYLLAYTSDSAQLRSEVFKILEFSPVQLICITHINLHLKSLHLLVKTVWKSVSSLKDWYANRQRKRLNFIQSELKKKDDSFMSFYN